MQDLAAAIDQLLTRAAALDSQGHHWSGEPAREFFAAADALRDAVEQLRYAQQFQHTFETSRTIEYDTEFDMVHETNAKVVYDIEGLEALHYTLTTEAEQVPVRDIDDAAISGLFVVQAGIKALIDMASADSAIYADSNPTASQYAAHVAEHLNGVLHRAEANNDTLRDDIAKVLAYRDKLAWSQLDDDRKNLYLETATGILGLAGRPAGLRPATI